MDEDFRAPERDGGGMNVLRLLMVDDHLMLTEALGARLSQAADLWVVGRCATGDPQLPAMVGRLRPDVITVDTDPVASPGELVRAVREPLPAVAVVVLTGGLDPDRAVDAARAGATGWVPKECGVQELTEVLRGVVRGHAWFPPEVLGFVLRGLREDVRSAGRRDGPLDVLSDREREVLRGMVEGKRGARIAEELAISTETVRTHTRSILSKLRVHSQLEAVSVASAAGLRAGPERLPRGPAPLPRQERADRARPERARPDRGRADQAQPDRAQPDRAQPDRAQSGLRPEQPRPDGPRPDRSEPEPR